MRRADRLFELIHLLRCARRAITAAQLAEALEVAPRTIYRDVAALMPWGCRSMVRLVSATFGYKAFGNPMTRASFGTACTRASSETPA